MHTRKERVRFAQKMRRRPTKAEKCLRKALTKLRKKVSREYGKSMAIFNFQVMMGHYILDFYLLRCRLAVEVDGASHDSKKQKAYDALRTKRLEKMNIKVLRFSNEDVLNSTDEVIDKIWQEAKVRFKPLHGERKRPHAKLWHQLRSDRAFMDRCNAAMEKEPSPELEAFIKGLEG